MTESSRFSRIKNSNWHQRLNSPLTCHLAGAGLGLMLMIAIALVWSRQRVVITEVERDGVFVDLADAAELIANADQWREEHATSLAQARLIDAQVESIRSWLPLESDWESTRHALRELAETCEVTVITLNESGSHVGSRVGVTTASCRVRGSYRDLCKYLYAFSGTDQPITVSELTIERIPFDREIDRRGESPCIANFAIRILAAAEGSLAGKLLADGSPSAGSSQQTPRLPGETNDAS